MDDRFYGNLSSVFRILQQQPDSIVDDTALERLLIWLEKVSLDQDPILADACIAFWENKELWEHSSAVSFALRLAGYIGRNFDGSDKSKTINESLRSLIKNTLSHEQFNEPTVKYGFYLGIKTLCSGNVEWLSYLEDTMKTLMKDISSTSMFVKKSVTEFLAVYLDGSLDSKKENCVLEDLVLSIQASDVTYLESITNCLIHLTDLNSLSAVVFITQTNFLEIAVSAVLDKKNNSCHCLLSSLIDLVNSLNSNDATNWTELLPLQADAKKFLENTITTLQQNDIKLKDLLPRFCACLIQKETTHHTFDEGWNKYLLTVILSSVISTKELSTILNTENDQSKQLVDDIKIWKKLLVTTIDVMSRIDKKLYKTEGCRDILNVWFSYCLILLQASMNNTVDIQLDGHLVATINDHKVSRLCFAYIKGVPINDLQEKARSEFIRTLLTIITSPSHSIQVSCSALELVRCFIRDGGLPALLSSCNHGVQTFGDILNMKLCSMDWEVKDSTLSLFIEILKICDSGGRQFLSENPRWCTILLDMLNDEESFVRSKAITLIQEVTLVEDVALVMLQKNNMSMEQLWKEVAAKFMDPYRQDDMFTRRSILNLITAWMADGVFTSPSSEQVARDNASTHCLHVNEIKPVLVNAAIDFDWETRSACVDVLHCIAKVTSALPQQKDWCFEFFEEMFDQTLRKCISDAEFIVQQKTLLCLQELKNIFADSAKTETNNTEKATSTFDEFEAELVLLGKSNSDSIRILVTSWNFGHLLTSLKEMDDKVKWDPVSFMEDIIASVQKLDENLLDCY